MQLVLASSAFVLGYLLGSIPFGIIVTRAAGAGDVREIGSGNIGATNVLRTGRKGLAAATLLLDAVKGAAAVIVVLLAWGYLAPHPASISAEARGAIAEVGRYSIAAAAIGALVGHCFPVWLRFRGGKGVATFLGALFPMSPPGGIAFIVIWLAAAYLTRYSSLAALLAVGSAPIIAWLMGGQFIGATLLVMAAVVIFRHSENIARLRAGTERRIGNAT